MKFKKLILFILIFIVSFSISYSTVSAEDKNAPGGIITKLPKTSNDPELAEGHVYPFWGPPCQRYTYSVVYRDREGRKPEYMKIYFNGKMIEMQKENPDDNDYAKGVKYIHQYVPNRIGSNFYYFEASNGFGKTRASIIDSPDNGPVLFTSAFDNNEIAVIDKQSGKKILEFSIGKEWVGGIALSDDGKYLAAKTSKHIYLFDTTGSKKPLWSITCEQCQIGDDVKGGIDISGDGSKIIAAFGERVALFDKTSNQPIWTYEAGSSYNVAISQDGEYMAAATAGDEANPNSNLIILWNGKNEKPMWQYHSSGNFHDVSLSDDGNFIAGSTGCPDRRLYLFSKDSNNPLIKSEPLTRDSPVHRTKISADGTLMAVGSESDAGAVFLFSKEKGQIWKFPTPQGSSVRALNFTPSGKYIGAATFTGDAYIFDKDQSRPIASWKVNASLGGVDIADDGSYIAAGGTDHRLYIFDKDSESKTEIIFNEYVEEVDISANGKYIAAGTGGSVYFFETYISQDREKTFDCSSIIEPISENRMRTEGGFGGQSASSLCGDKKCEGPETKDNCKQDCDSEYQRSKTPDLTTIQSKKTGMIFGFGLVVSILLLIVTIAIRKLSFFERQKNVLIRYNISKLSFLKLTGKKITVLFSILAVLFFTLTIAAIFLNRNSRPVILQHGKQTTPESDKAIMNQVEKPALNEGRQESGICGNNLCEPDLGESKEICPEDCSAGD